MVKLATPISTLFEDESASKEIIARSYCLECRGHTVERKEPKQYIFHFDKDVVHKWTRKEKDFLNSVIALKNELRLITFHMLTACDEPVLKDGVFYFAGRMLSRQELLDNARDNIEWIRKCLQRKNIEIGAENNNYYPTSAYQYITDSDFITQVVVENKISFIFDMAHAKITSYNKKSSYDEYITELPMNRMIQIHVSKTGINDKGWAYDTHELPDSLIFEEVKKIVHKFSPKYITIEYYKDKDGLIQVLEQYRKLCFEPKGAIV